MTLIVETGSLVSNANSFVSLDTANAYFDVRHDEGWEAAEDTAKERALVLAADYMTQAWRLKWRGSLVNATQALPWPRDGVPVPDFFDPFETHQPNVPIAFQDTYFIGVDTVPQEVKDAQMLLARAQMDSAGAVVNTLQASLGRQTKREKVGSLEVEYMTPADGGRAQETTYYWDAEKRVEPFFIPSSGMVGQLART